MKSCCLHLSSKASQISIIQQFVTAPGGYNLTSAQRSHVDLLKRTTGWLSTQACSRALGSPMASLVAPEGPLTPAAGFSGKV